jgi:hypothetical protein
MVRTWLATVALATAGLAGCEGHQGGEDGGSAAPAAPAAPACRMDADLTVAGGAPVRLTDVDVSQLGENGRYYYVMASDFELPHDGRIVTVNAPPPGKHAVVFTLRSDAPAPLIKTGMTLATFVGSDRPGYTVMLWQDTNRARPRPVPAARSR